MSSESDLRPEYADDQPGEEAYKRGNQHKWTKTRRSDYDRDDTADSDSKKFGETNANKEPRLPKRKVAVMVGFCGTGYHGMQYNPPNPTIESELFNAFVKAGAISKANSTDLRKSGFMRAARTDKGVHAGGNVISLKLIIEDPDILKKINDNLPEGIRVWDFKRVNKAFDCRKMCSSRWYEYLLPTYSFIGPKPGSALFEDIELSKVEKPGVIPADEESAGFWAAFNKDAVKTFSEAELSEINEYVPPPRNEFDETDPTYQLVRQFKQLENTHRRAYRVSTAKLEAFRAAMAQYLGPHNFHNFTLGKDFKDPSAIRFMKEIKVSDPFVIGECKTEWVSIKIHGQSFMLHQIRKMISMATLVTRCSCPADRITESYGAQKINIPKAPALGLLLECPVYEGYNKRLQEFGYAPINFDEYQNEMDAFKMKYIYDKIYQEEVDENVFNAFFSYIDSFSKVTGVHSEAGLAGSEVSDKFQKSVFDFLTARGIHNPKSNANSKPLE
ncbi:LAMI_0G10088g1_1 [Lachancea mirantina]|uniref:tRNA pseudouridine synthase 1 n=1 Tax=Lachancea mirantina TaxID=1230905 RepID=A0A1G4KAJ8_9SACH|nr:LAMI_0G10088g1_1 [Lachancea mirantina]